MNYLIFSFFNSAHQFQNLHNAVIIRVPTSQTVKQSLQLQYEPPPPPACFAWVPLRPPEYPPPPPDAPSSSEPPPPPQNPPTAPGAGTPLLPLFIPPAWPPIQP